MKRSGSPSSAARRARLTEQGGRVLLHLPPLTQAAHIKIIQWLGNAELAAKVSQALLKVAAPANLTALTKGGKARFTQTVTTKGVRGDDKGAYTLDSLAPLQESLQIVDALRRLRFLLRRPRRRLDLERRRLDRLPASMTSLKS